MKNVKRLFAVLLAATMVLALAACGGSGSSGGSSDSDSGVIKLGGIGPLTGAAAIYGNATRYGSEIAVEEINALGDIQFKISWEDDEHDAEKSVNAYNTLKDWGMQILIGTTTTTPCVAVSAESNSDRIFELTPSASSPDVLGVDDGRKDNVFQMCFTDPNQGTASAQYISEQALGTKIAVIYNNADAYSTGIYNKFAAEAENLALEIVSTTTFTDETNDFSVQLNDAKNAGADLVFLPMYYTPASLILKQAKDIDYAPKFFGVDGMDGILTLEGFDTSLAEGVMLLTPFSADATDEKTQTFVKTYKEKHNDDVPNQFAADAYDCVYAIYEAIKANGVTADMSNEEICQKMIETFTGDFSFNGITGDNVSWSDNGEVSKSPKGVIIQNGVYVGM